MHAACITRSQSITITYLFLKQRTVSMSRMCEVEAELLWSGRELTTKVGEQPWPQLVRCASIYYHIYDCIFQEDRIVVRSAGEEWYID